MLEEEYRIQISQITRQNFFMKVANNNRIVKRNRFQTNSIVFDHTYSMFIEIDQLLNLKSGILDDIMTYQLT